MYKLVVSLVLISVVLSADATGFVMNNFCACPKITDETACGAAINCEWNASKECVNKAAGTTPAPAECKTFTDKTKCETSPKECRFIPGADGTKPNVGTCVALKCSDLTTGATGNCIRTAGRVTCQETGTTTVVCSDVTACSALTSTNCTNYFVAGVRCVLNADSSKCSPLTQCAQILEDETTCNSKIGLGFACQYNETSKLCAPVTACSQVTSNASNCNNYQFAAETCTQTGDKLCAAIKDCTSLPLTSTFGGRVCTDSNRCVVQKEKCVAIECGDVEIGSCTTYNSSFSGSFPPLCYTTDAGKKCKGCFGSINSVAFAVIAIVLALFF